MVYEQNKFLSANNNDIDFNALELERGDSCQGAFFLKQTGHRDPKSSSIDLGKIRVWWRRIGSGDGVNVHKFHFLFAFTFTSETLLMWKTMFTFSLSCQVYNGYLSFVQ